MLVLVGKSTVEPLTLDEVKLHCRLSTSSTAEDSLLSALITVARQQAENYMGRALVPSTYQVILDDFPAGAIELPMPPISTAAPTITYTKDDTAGSSTSVASTAFTFDSDSVPGRVYPSYGNEWPDDVREQPKAVQVQYACGYSSTSPVPDSIKAWMKLFIGTMYENRENVMVQQGLNAAIELPRSYCNGLLDPYVVIKVV